MSSEWCTIESDPAVFIELIQKLGCQDIDVDEIYSLDSLTSKITTDTNSNSNTNSNTESKSESKSSPNSISAIDQQFPSDLNEILLENVHGYIFLFKYMNQSSSNSTTSTTDATPTSNTPLSFEDSTNYRNKENEGLYYASQIVQDACATQAILSILLNMSLTKSKSKSTNQLGSLLTDFKSFTNEFDYEMKGLTIGNSDQIRGMHIYIMVMMMMFMLYVVIYLYL